MKMSNFLIGFGVQVVLQILILIMFIKYGDNIIEFILFIVALTIAWIMGNITENTLNKRLRNLGDK